MSYIPYSHPSVKRDKPETELYFELSTSIKISGWILAILYFMVTASFLNSSLHHEHSNAGNFHGFNN